MEVFDPVGDLREGFLETCCPSRDLKDEYEQPRKRKGRKRVPLQRQRHQLCEGKEPGQWGEEKKVCMATAEQRE